MCLLKLQYLFRKPAVLFGAQTDDGQVEVGINFIRLVRLLAGYRQQVHVARSFFLKADGCDVSISSHDDASLASFQLHSHLCM